MSARIGIKCFSGAERALVSMGNHSFLETKTNHSALGLGLKIKKRDYFFRMKYTAAAIATIITMAITTYHNGSKPGAAAEVTAVAIEEEAL